MSCGFLFLFSGFLTDTSKKTNDQGNLTINFHCCKTFGSFLHANFCYIQMRLSTKEQIIFSDNWKSPETQLIFSDVDEDYVIKSSTYSHLLICIATNIKVRRLSLLALAI